MSQQLLLDLSGKASARSQGQARRYQCAPLTDQARKYIRIQRRRERNERRKAAKQEVFGKEKHSPSASRPTLSERHLSDGDGWSSSKGPSITLSSAEASQPQMTILDGGDVHVAASIDTFGSQSSEINQTKQWSPFCMQPSASVKSMIEDGRSLDSSHAPNPQNDISPLPLPSSSAQAAEPTELLYDALEKELQCATCSSVSPKDEPQLRHQCLSHLHEFHVWLTLPCPLCVKTFETGDSRYFSWRIEHDCPFAHELKSVNSGLHLQAPQTFRLALPKDERLMHQKEPTFYPDRLECGHPVGINLWYEESLTVKSMLVNTPAGQAFQREFSKSIWYLSPMPWAYRLLKNLHLTPLGVMWFCPFAILRSITANDVCALDILIGLPDSSRPELQWILTITAPSS